MASNQCDIYIYSIQNKKNDRHSIVEWNSKICLRNLIFSYLINEQTDRIS